MHMYTLRNTHTHTRALTHANTNTHTHTHAGAVLQTGGRFVPCGSATVRVK